jgi:hypothetical protein
LAEGTIFEGWRAELRAWVSRGFGFYLGMSTASASSGMRSNAGRGAHTEFGMQIEKDTA